ncbi:Fc receptor-like protein 6 [Kogia breviceps]|uniref:Fc receptor-like protein 6 n=1 Tax=Kogia breviceps TaxID=27615 RepID=UPI0034D19B9B
MWADEPQGLSWFKSKTHQPSCGAPPLRSSFYLNGDTLWNHVAPHGGSVSILFPVMSEQDAGNYACEAENSVSKETSKPETLSVDGPLPPWNLPPAPGGEEHPLYVNVHCQNENDEGVIYSVVRTIPKESERTFLSSMLR